MLLADASNGDPLVEEVSREISTLASAIEIMMETDLGMYCDHCQRQNETEYCAFCGRDLEPNRRRMIPLG